MPKVNKLSEGAIKALKMLKEGSATAHDLKQKGFTDVNSSHLKALENRGLVSSVEVEKELIQVVRRKVKEYTITNEGKEFKGE